MKFGFLANALHTLGDAQELNMAKSVAMNGI